MKLAIVGSRTFNDMDKIVDVFNNHFTYGDAWDIDEIISGGAKGADTVAKNTAIDHRIKYTEFPADWNKYGKSAGFISNQQIVDACDMVLAFWDGKSRGTADTIEKAKKAKKPTMIVYF